MVWNSLESDAFSDLVLLNIVWILDTFVAWIHRRMFQIHHFLELNRLSDFVRDLDNPQNLVDALFCILKCQDLFVSAVMFF